MASSGRVDSKRRCRYPAGRGKVRALTGTIVHFDIRLDPTAEQNLRRLTARQRAIVIDEIEKQLRFEPKVATKNRKRMRENPLSTWELRVGTLRVYYDVWDDPEPIVLIRAIGIKEGNRVRFP